MKPQESVFLSSVPLLMGIIYTKVIESRSIWWGDVELDSERRSKSVDLVEMLDDLGGMYEFWLELISLVERKKKGKRKTD